MMKQLGGAIIVVLSLVACSAPREAAPPVSTVRTVKEIRSPMNVVADFRATLRAQAVSDALFFIDEVNYGTPAAEQVRFRIKKLADEMAGGAYDYKPVEEQIQDDCAAVIVRENPNRPGPAVYGLYFLIKRDERWKISPEPQNYQKILGLTAAQGKSLLALDRWYQLRKADLRLEERGK